MNVIHDENQIRGFFGEYRWLSNFWYAPIKYGSETYPTNEHFYQAMKSDQLRFRETVRAAATPGKAKYYGSRKGMAKLGFNLRDNWEEIKYAVMMMGVLRKFEQNPALGRKLLDTGERHLYELNNWDDHVWGVTENEDGSLTGDNALGVTLMRIRTQLRNDLTAGIITL